MDPCVSIKTITEKPEVRMGKGKGPVEYWVAEIKRKMLYEIQGVSEELAREALTLASEAFFLKHRL